MEELMGKIRFYLKCNIRVELFILFHFEDRYMKTKSIRRPNPVRIQRRPQNLLYSTSSPENKAFDSFTSRTVIDDNHIISVVRFRSFTEYIVTKII